MLSEFATKLPGSETTNSILSANASTPQLVSGMSGQYTLGVNVGATVGLKVTHVPTLHSPWKQSASMIHVPPVEHDGQNGPPQSTSVSSKFIMSSMHAMLVGKTVGATVGYAEGSGVGDSVGVGVGDVVGWAEGTLVGEKVGYFEGAMDG